jgi:hypothetical protein
MSGGQKGDNLKIIMAEAALKEQKTQPQELQQKSRMGLRGQSDAAVNSSLEM